MSLVKSKIQGIKVDKVVDPSSRFDFPLLNNLAYTDNLVEKYLGKKNFLKEYLGKGTFGYAYLTKNGTVYKFTKNEKEAAASLILFMFGDKLKTQGKIYKVYEVVIGSERLFIIEKEYVKPIGQYIEKEFNLKAYQTYKPLIIIEGLLYSQYDNFETFEKEALEKADDEDAETFKIIKELFEKKNKLMRSIFEFNKLLGENEQDAGIPLNDQHVGNIGVKDNRVICFDCVTSSKYILKQGGMIKNEIKKSTIKSRLSEPAVKKIGKLGWSKVSPVIWKKIIDEKHHAYINNQGASYDLVIYDSSKSDKDPIDGGSFGSFEDAEEWLIENYIDKKMEDGGITGEKVGDFIFVQKSDGYWRVFKKNGQKVAIIVKESNSLPNVLPYLSPIGKQDVFLVTSLAGKQEKFASLEDVKKAFAEFKMEDGGRSSEKTEIKFSSYSSDRKIMTFTRSDFKEMLNEINRNFKGRLFYTTDKVTKLTDIFNYGTLFPDYISFTFKIKDINPISDGEKLKNIIEKYTDRVNWSYGSIILYEKESDWNVAVTISPQLIDTQSKRTLDDNRTEHKFQDEKHDDDYLIPDNITVKLENGSLIDSPKILGSTLKKYFKQKYDLDIDTTYKKTVRGLDDSYYQISSYRSGKSIPNEVRREIIEISHGKPISEIGVLNQNDISYGTIEPKRISVSGKVWKEWIKSKETKNELDNGGNIDFENTPNIEIDQDQEYLIEKAIPWIKKGMSDNYIQWKLYASRGLNTSIEDIVEAIRLARLRLMKDGGKTSFYSSCVSYPDIEDLETIIENEKEISREAFNKNVDNEERIDLEKNLGYTKDFPITKDYHVKWFRSKDKDGNTVYFIRHSATEYIFKPGGSRFKDGGDLEREFIERSYGKESVKNIIKNEGLIYAIRSYMGYESINEKEDKLRSLWKQAGEQIDMVEESAKKEGYDPGYLVHDKKEGYRIISKPEGDEISVSNVSKDLQDKVSKANDLFLKILNYVGLSEKQFGSKFEDGGEIKTKRKITFYHGVKREENVEKILKSGFDLKHINPLWQNDYAISVTRNPESIRRFFGNKNIPIIKIEFEGVIVPQVEIGFLLAKDAVDYTNQIIRMGIDAVALDGSFGQAFIYNLKSIKNISLLPTGSKKEDGGTTKDKRYAVTTDMYSYAPDDQSVIKKSQEFVGDLRKRLDNQASIVEIVEAPFGSIKTRKLENVPKYNNGARIEGVDTKYTRVIPRDLFNESKLLKCVGRLILLIHDNSVPVEMSFEENGDPFKIGLMDEVALTITNLKIFIKNKEYIFKTTYNSKSNYPFYVQYDYVDYRVFDEKGEFDNEFMEFCKTVDSTTKLQNGGMKHWEIEKQKADARKYLLKQYPDIGKIVKRRGRGKWEYGVVILKGDTLYIRYDNQKSNDAEELIGLPFEYAPEYVLQYIKEDGTLK